MQYIAGLHAVMSGFRSREQVLRLALKTNWKKISGKLVPVLAFCRLYCSSTRPLTEGRIFLSSAVRSRHLLLWSGLLHPSRTRGAHRMSITSQADPSLDEKTESLDFQETFSLFNPVISSAEFAYKVNVLYIAALWLFLTQAHKKINVVTINDEAVKTAACHVISLFYFFFLFPHRLIVIPGSNR